VFARERNGRRSDLLGDLLSAACVGGMVGIGVAWLDGTPGSGLLGVAFFAVISLGVAIGVRLLLGRCPESRPILLGICAGALGGVFLTFLVLWGLIPVFLFLSLTKLLYTEGLAFIGLFIGPVFLSPFGAATGAVVGGVIIARHNGRIAPRRNDAAPLPRLVGVLLVLGGLMLGGALSIGAAVELQKHALMHAAGRRDVEQVRRWAQFNQPHARWDWHRSALHGAINRTLDYESGGYWDYEKEREVLTIIANSRPDVNDEICQFIFRVTLSESHLAVARALLERGFDVNERPRVGADWPFLAFAVERGELEAARLLLEHGADANAEFLYSTYPGGHWGRKRFTPLSYARARAADGDEEAVRRYDRVIDLLRAHGARDQRRSPCRGPAAGVRH
jgi:hypothetical protein